MKMAWRTFERKLADGDLEVVAWPGDAGGENLVDVLLWKKRGGARERHVVELMGKPSKAWTEES